MSDSPKGKSRWIQGVLILAIAGGVWTFNNCQPLQDFLRNSETQEGGETPGANAGDGGRPAQPAPGSNSGNNPGTEPKTSDRNSRDRNPKPPAPSKESGTEPVSTARLTPDNGAQKIARAFRNKQSDLIVTTRAKVVHLLPDDNVGIKHQNFLVEIGFGRDLTLKVSHNTDLAPSLPLRKGDFVEIKGEYEYTDKGGVLHWTHHDPRKRRPGGYIKLGDQIYQEE